MTRSRHVHLQTLDWNDLWTRTSWRRPARARAAAHGAYRVIVSGSFITAASSPG